MINELIVEAMQMYYVGRNQLFSEQRSKGIVKCRSAIEYSLHLLGFSLPKIGKIMGRDHSTVAHAIKSIEEDDIKNGIYLFLKYRDEDISLLNLDRKCVKDVIFEEIRKRFNIGMSVNEISEDIDLNQDFVLKTILDFPNKLTVKKVPDYKKSIIKTIYI